MYDEHDPQRSEEMDLVEVTSRLGEPDSVHRTNSGSVIWRFVVGVLIVLVAVTSHYLFWSGQVGWPRGVKPWILTLVIMFVGPGVGIYLIAFAVRGMKLSVLVYSTGLFIRHRGHVLAVPWDELRAVEIHGLPEKAVLHYPLPDPVWYDLARSHRRIMGTTIVLRRLDGQKITLMSTLQDFYLLGKTVQEETFRRLYPEYMERLANGGVLRFGTISCDQTSISMSTRTLAWSKLRLLERMSDQLHVKQVGKKKAWGKTEFSGLINPHVLMGIVAVLRPEALPESPSETPQDDRASEES